MEEKNVSIEDLRIVVSSEVLLCFCIVSLAREVKKDCAKMDELLLAYLFGKALWPIPQKSTFLAIKIAGSSVCHFCVTRKRPSFYLTLLSLRKP